MRPDPGSEAADMMAVWQRTASGLDAGFGEPVIRDHLIAAADNPDSFAKAFANLRRDLEAQPWLSEVAGYDWVLERNAYNLPVEALNQQRVLNALAGLAELADVPDWRAAAHGIVARQTLRWRLEDAGPSFVPRGRWRFVVLPFGWDNLVYLLVAALRGHMASRTGGGPLFDARPAIDDWRRPAKGMLLAAMPLPGAREARVDSFSLDRMRHAHDWWRDAIISQHELDDDVARTLWSISSDFVVGHEIAHAMLHPDIAGSLERELEADRAGLFALWKWTRPRDLTSLAAGHGSGFYDYLSALVGTMMLVTAGALQHGFHGLVAGDMVEATRIRATAIQRFTEANVAATRITPDEHRLAAGLLEAFELFLHDLLTLNAATPADARAAARVAGRAAIRTLEIELAEHKREHGIAG